MHEVGELALSTGNTVESYVGQTFNGFELTADDAKTLYKGYVAPVRTLAEGGQLFLEQRLSISHITCEEDAAGTSDTVILFPHEIVIADLKWGMGVRVDAFENDQLIMYALAALEEFSLIHDFTQARLVIFQPRLQHIDEWVVPIDELLAHGERLKKAAARATIWLKQGANAIPDSEFAPSEDVCRWCDVKARCKALERHSFSQIIDDFDALDTGEEVEAKLNTAKENVRLNDNARLGALLTQVPLIQDWCKALIAAAESEVHAGREIPGYKLVQGKAGNRKWIEAAEAEKTMKSLRLKASEMYEYKLISPTTAEKLLEDAKPKAWEKLQSHITKSPGSPTVVPVSDKRPAITVTSPEDDFNALA